MSTLVPSYITKVERGQKHLKDLEVAINTFASGHPYHVTTSFIQGKRQKMLRRLEFTQDAANTDIPILLADVVYNLRSALDHLMTSLVAPNKRGHVYFPIYFQGVWVLSGPGENEQRVKERGRWLADTEAVAEGAKTILKRMQPPDGGETGKANLLAVLNRLSNTDRHTQLPVVARGLRSVALRWTLPNGTVQKGGAGVARGLIEDRATLHGIPDQAVDVQAYGEVVVAVRVRVQSGHAQFMQIPRDLFKLVNVIRGGPGLPPGVRGIIPDLVPFVRDDAP